MTSSHYRIVSTGGCYVDLNVPGFPIERLRTERDAEIVGGDYELVAGGSAVNVCRRLVQTGVFAPVFVGVVGGDEMGSMAKSLLEKDGVEAHLFAVNSVSTPVSFNMSSAEGDHVMLVAGTANQMLDERVVPMINEQLEGAKYLFLGGLYKLRALMPHASALAEAARERGVQIVIDHGRVPDGVSNETVKQVQDVVLAADIYLPSRDEFLRTWGIDTIEQGIERLTTKAPHLIVAVKDGSREVKYFSPEESGSVQPPRVENVVDLTGAGDTFNAYMLAALAQGSSLKEAVQSGAEAASRKVAGEKIEEINK